MPSDAASNSLEPIVPDAVYPLSAFYKASGLGRRSIALAAQRGVELPMFRVGRRKFVRGSDAIAFIEQAASQRACS